jgi:hypothetical protein
VLQQVSLLWKRPGGPVPSPIFSERLATLSRLHGLPPPQSSGQLQGDTPLGQLVLQDMAEHNAVVEAYRPKR